jgi:hypothetical protein
MKSFCRHLFLSIISIALFTHCSSSLVYSPALNLPAKPIAKEEVDVQVGFEYLPETRPDKLYTTSSKKVTPGLNAQLGYGFTETFSLHARGWMTTSDDDGKTYRGGYSLAGHFLVNQTETSRFMIIPRAGLLISGDEPEGYGFALSGIYHRNLTPNLAWYAGTGFLYGFRNSSNSSGSINDNNIPRDQNGYGIITNIGGSWKFFDGWRMNLEVNPLYQINNFDENEVFIIAPQLGIGYTFR